MTVTATVTATFATNDVIRLCDVVFGHERSLLLEVVGGATGSPGYMAALVQQPYQRLHVTPKDVFFKSATPNRDNLLSIEPVATERTVVLLASAAPAKAAKSLTALTAERYCVGVTSDDRLVSVRIAGPLPAAPTLQCPTHGLVSVWFALSTVSLAALASTVAAAAAAPVAPVATAASQHPQRQQQVLQAWQLRRFASEGFLHVPGLIPRDRVDHCAAFLLHHMGLVGCLVGGGVQGNQYGKFPGQVSNSDVVRNLVLTTRVHDVVTQLFGTAIWNRKNISAQIAFRYPQFRTNITNDNCDNEIGKP
jgi:hypothetical protein